MKGQFLIGSNESFIESNIYADKSSVILDWLLRKGILADFFSLREIQRETNISLGLIQKVLETLVFKGFVQVEGVRTGKKFKLKKPHLLLKSWIESYDILKKCKTWSYQTGFSSKSEMFKALRKSKLGEQVALSLHSAAEAYKCKNTNLNTLELYIADIKAKAKLEDILQLEPQEKGYQVLMIQPYYKHLITHSENFIDNIRVTSSLLTFLDLYHFPLRGHEQAEFMAERILELKRINKRA